jgi:hypothetical protein
MQRWKTTVVRARQWAASILSCANVTPCANSAPAIYRVSGTERANRSSFGTTKACALRPSNSAEEIPPSISESHTIPWSHGSSSSPFGARAKYIFPPRCRLRQCHPAFQKVQGAYRAANEERGRAWFQGRELPPASEFLRILALLDFRLPCVRLCNLNHLSQLADFEAFVQACEELGVEHEARTAYKAVQRVEIPGAAPR